jgi:hypothetical protein
MGTPSPMQTTQADSTSVRLSVVSYPVALVDDEQEARRHQRRHPPPAMEPPGQPHEDQGHKDRVPVGRIEIIDLGSAQIVKPAGVGRLCRHGEDRPISTSSAAATASKKPDKLACNQSNPASAASPTRNLHSARAPSGPKPSGQPSSHSVTQLNTALPPVMERAARVLRAPPRPSDQSSEPQRRRHGSLPHRHRRSWSHRQASPSPISGLAAIHAVAANRGRCHRSGSRP